MFVIIKKKKKKIIMNADTFIKKSHINNWQCY